MAALAYGTQTITPVDKIVGPGNAYVAAAKRRVFGQVGIDLIAGPSEILVVADAQQRSRPGSPPTCLSQAEHDAASQSILITDDAGLRRRRDARRRARSSRPLPRADIAGASWRDNGAIILVPDLARRCALVDRIAPSIVELAMATIRRGAGRADPPCRRDLPRPLYARGDRRLCRRHQPRAADLARGALLVRASASLDFLKRTSLVACTPDALAALGPAALALAEAEGLGAHGRSVSIRLNRRS